MSSAVSDDEVRDRFRDHTALGPEIATIPAMEGEECKEACTMINEAALYSWTPDDDSDDEAVVGELLVTIHDPLSASKSSV